MLRFLHVVWLLMIGRLNVSDAASGSMSVAQIKDILYWHNKARSEIAASGRCSNMLEMEWDKDVARAAQSNNCPTSHNRVAAKTYGKYLGENLAWASSTCSKGGLCEQAGACGSGGSGGSKCEADCNTSICTLKNRAYLGWYQEETEDPKSTTDNCRSFNNGGGHCTQMVWQNSNKLGCSYQAGCGRWGTTLSCNYYPAGNMNVGGGAANIGNCRTGKACVACPTTHPYCKNGLCSRFESGAPDSSSSAASSTQALVGSLTVYLISWLAWWW